MAELVREVCGRPTITGVSPARKDLPAFRLDGLLQPPRIEALDPYLFPAQDQVDGIIDISTSADYRVMNVYIVWEDEQGKQIESGFALRDEAEEDERFYFPSAPLRAGASVKVRAIAMDALGGVGTRDENLTVCS